VSHTLVVAGVVSQLVLHELLVQVAQVVVALVVPHQAQTQQAALT
jgi:hypothetical protein